MGERELLRDANPAFLQLIRRGEAAAIGRPIGHWISDFPAPTEMKEAAKRAIDADVNQYAVTWGAPNLRAAVAERTTAYNGIPTAA